MIHALKNDAHVLIIMMCMCLHATSASATEPLEDINQPAIPPPVSTFEDTPDKQQRTHRVQPIDEEGEVPVYLYPAFSRRVEIGAQIALSTLWLWPLGYGRGLMLDAGIVREDDLRVFLVTNSLVDGLLYSLMVYNVGRANLSKASFLSTYAGAVAGGLFSIVVSGPLVRTEYPGPGRIAASVTISSLSMLAGAVAGYQLSSTWEKGQSIGGGSPALSFGLMPMRDGVTGSFGVRF